MTTTNRTPYIIIIAIAVLALSGCGPVRPLASVNATPTQDVMSAQATAVQGNASAQVAIANATYTAEQANIRATAEAQATDSAINATLSAHDIAYAPTRAAIQATIDTARANEAQARLDAARINVEMAVTKQAQAYEQSQTEQYAAAKLASLEIISKTDAVSVTTALRQIEVDKANDLAFQLPDLIGRWWQLITLFVVLACLVWLVRAGAARLAGDRDRAMLVLGHANHPLLQPASANVEYDPWETPEHGNTENTGNTEENTENTAPSVFPVHYSGGVTYIPRMTPEERTAVYKAKDTAIRILQAAVAYNQAHQSDPDCNPAKIARYDALNVKAEDRGDVCNMLEDLNPAAVSIKKGGNNQGTFVTPEYGASVESLLRLIMSNDVRLYPRDFRSAAVEAAEALNSGINALPGVTR